MADQLSSSRCPGCGLRLPHHPSAHYDGYYNCSAECWAVFAEVLGYEYGHVVAFAQVHTLTVDTYAVQHVGGRHKAKSVALHLAGLYGHFELGLDGRETARLLQSLAAHYTNFPVFDPPPSAGALTVIDVALAADQLDHIERVKRWAAEVWRGWTSHHQAIARFAEPARLAAVHSGRY